MTICSVASASDAFHAVATPKQNSDDHILGQGYKSLLSNVVKRDQAGLEGGQAYHAQVILNFETTNTDYALEEATVELVERDEISRSYIDTPNTSYPILEQHVDGVAIVTNFLEIKSDLDVSTPTIMQRFEATSTLHDGEHSDYKLLHGDRLAAILEAKYEEHAWSLASSRVAEVSKGSIIDALPRGASVIDIQALPDAQGFKETHGCDEDTRIVDAEDQSRQDFAEIGAQFDEYAELHVEAMAFALEEEA